MTAAQFLELIRHLEAWEADPDAATADMRTAPFYPVVQDQRLEAPVRRLREKLDPHHRRWLWAKIKTRLAALVTRGSPRQVGGRIERGEWQLKIPAASCGWLNANQGHHRAVEARRRSEWRHHVYQHGLTQRRQLPSGLQYVKVDLQFQVKTYRLRDNANLHPTAKPIIDAFGPQRTYARTRPDGQKEMVREPGLGVYVGDDPTHMAAGGAFLDWFDEAYTGPLDGVVWMRIIDLSPR